MRKLYSFVSALFFIFAITPLFNLSFSQVKSLGGLTFPIQLPSAGDFDFRLGVDDFPSWTGFDIRGDVSNKGKILIGINPERPLSDVFSIVSMYPHGSDFTTKLSLNSDGGALFTGALNLRNSHGETNSILNFLWNTSSGNNTSYSISQTSESKLSFTRSISSGENIPVMSFDAITGNMVNVGIGTSSPQAMLDVAGSIKSTGLSTGTTSIQGGLSVTGTSTFARDVTFNATANINNNLIVNGNTRLGESLSLNSSTPSGYTLKLKTLGNDDWGIEHTGMISDDNSDWYGMGLRIMDNGSNGFYIRDKTTNQKRLVIKDGKVGIGKSNPQYVLDVNGSINATDLKINGNSLMDKLWVPINGGLSFTGSIGIGTTTPKGRMHVAGDIVVGNDASNQKFIMHTRTENSGDFLQIAPDNAQGNWNWSEGLTLTRSGNVGIGVTNPTQKLSVEGTILSKEVLVSIDAANWPDYVFQDDYQLKDLKEVEKFIEVNNHLPEIPSAKEIGEKGVNIGEMTNKLLKKIEELTLYVIEQDKKIQQLEEKISGSDSQK